LFHLPWISPCASSQELKLGGNGVLFTTFTLPEHGMKNLGIKYGGYFVWKIMPTLKNVERLNE
jgi:hypothetical protein